MDFLTICVVLFVLTVVVAAVRLGQGDCDLTLQWFEKFGKSAAELKGKIVWITGASSGIGEGLAYELAAAGCRLVLSARREDLLEEVKKKCCVTGNLREDDILVLPLDLLAYDTHSNAVETVIKYFKKIDILVNNAGRSQRAMCEDTSLSIDKQVLELNFLGAVSVTKAVLPQFRRQGHGHFVVTSSLAGKLGAPGLGSYSSSKHALQGWFDCLRIEAFTKNILVTMVCPGSVYSQSLMHAFTGKENESLGVEMKPGEHRMSTDRCSHLIGVAIANQVDEVWVAVQPELTYVYLFQYLPGIARWLGKRLGQKRVQAVQQGKSNLHA
ncbi:hypothetical protein ScPMuIL_014469 [Solemya velum]